MMKRTLFVLLSLGAPLFAARGDLLSSSKIASLSKKDLTGLLKQYSMQELPLQVEGADVYKITYETIDPSQNVSICSGALVIPKNSNKPLPLLSYGHGTMCTRKDVPTQMNFQLLAAIAAFSTGGYVIAATDYLGLGDSDLIYHPYCHADSLASSSIDMLKASKAFCQKRQISLDSSLFVTGYSEGGMTAMAVHRAIEKDPSLGMKVTASCPMSGPYDLSGATFAAGLARPSPRASTYFCFLLKGYNMIYSELFSSMEECFIPTYAYKLNMLFDGSQSMFDIERSLPLDPKEMVKQEFLAKLTSDPKSSIVQKLQENNTYQWTPKAPMLLLGVSGDLDVSYHNAEVAFEWMKSHGASVSLKNLGSTFDHLTGSTPCHLEARKFFDTFYLSK